MPRFIFAACFLLLSACSTSAVQPASVDAEKQAMALRLVRVFKGINMLKVQAAMSTLKFEEHNKLLCAAGRSRMMEFLEPAIEAEVAPRAAEYERLLAKEIASRMEKFELSYIFEKKDPSPFLGYYFEAQSAATRAIAPETIRLGSELGHAAIVAALAQANEAGLKVEPGGACRE